MKVFREDGSVRHICGSLKSVSERLSVYGRNTEISHGLLFLPCGLHFFSL